MCVRARAPFHALGDRRVVISLVAPITLHVPELDGDLLRHTLERRGRTLGDEHDLLKVGAGDRLGDEGGATRRAQHAPPLVLAHLLQRLLQLDAVVYRHRSVVLQLEALVVKRVGRHTLVELAHPIKGVVLEVVLGQGGLRRRLEQPLDLRIRRLDLERLLKRLLRLLVSP